MAVYLGSGLTTDFPSAVSIRQQVRMFSTLSADGALTVGGAATLASTFSVGGTTTFSGAVTIPQLSLTSVDFLSVSTGANSSSMTNKELRVVFAASGISLVYSSGATTYIIGGSATSAAQA